MCSDAIPIHCSTDQGKTASLLFCAALLFRLTPVLCHRNCTCEVLFSTQVYGDTAPMHCSTGQGKKASLLFSAALLFSLTPVLCHRSCTYGDLFWTQVNGEATPMHCSTGQGKTASLLFSAALLFRLTPAKAFLIAVWQHSQPQTLSTAKNPCTLSALWL